MPSSPDQPIPTPPHRNSVERHWQQLATTETPDTELNLLLRQHQASELHETLPLTNFATAMACLILGWIFAMNEIPHTHLAVWISLGLISCITRLLVWRWYGRHKEDLSEVPPARLFLGICIAASLSAGAMFGWAWWCLVSVDGPLFLAFFYTHIAFIFGALYAYSTLWQAQLTYVLSGLLPGIIATWRDYQVDPSPWGWGQSVGLALIAALSLMFSARSSQLFRSRIQLEDRVFRLLDQVTKKRDDAINATLDKSRFLAAVSHDLRQPMQAINLYLTSLSRSYERQLAKPQDVRSVDAVKSSIGLLQESTVYLNAMFESLLDISRLDAGAVKVELQHTYLTRMVAQLEAEFRRVAEAEGLGFCVALPRQFQLMEVHTDPAILERLLRNLIVNALRYTQRGGVRLSIVAKGRQLDFRVVDTGPGIEKAMQRRIFEEFFQLPGSQQSRRSTSATGRGMGLGLSIAARLAGRLESTIRLYSHLHLGSVFAVSQPMRVALKPGPDVQVATDTHTVVPFNEDFLIVLIDDDLNVLRSIRLFMESVGATVVAATNSRDAIRHLARHSQAPDLIVSDWRLGLEDGVQCIAALREEFNSEIPAVLITGDTAIEHVTLFSESGLRVLHKPVTGEQLINALSQELLTFKRTETVPSEPSP